LALSIFSLQFSIYERAKGMPDENSSYNPNPSPSGLVAWRYNLLKNKGNQISIDPTRRPRDGMRFHIDMESLP
jgi:hypothetical protein